jgi:hypothetical protein
VLWYGLTIPLLDPACHDLRRGWRAHGRNPVGVGVYRRRSRRPRDAGSQDHSRRHCADLPDLPSMVPVGLLCRRRNVAIATIIP